MTRISPSVCGGGVVVIHGLITRLPYVLLSQRFLYPKLKDTFLGSEDPHVVSVDCPEL